MIGRLATVLGPLLQLGKNLIRRFPLEAADDVVVGVVKGGTGLLWLGRTAAHTDAKT